MQVSGQVGPVLIGDGTGTNPLRQSRTGDLNVTEVHGKYYEQTRRGSLFYARAVVTAPAGLASSNGIGGPLLWNGSSNVIAYPIALSVCETVVSTVAGALGFAMGQQATAPTGTTAIDGSGSTLLGASTPACSVYRIGTVSLVPPQFFPLVNITTGSLTTTQDTNQWFDIGGAFGIPYGYYMAIAATATLSTMAAQIGLIWEEVPV